MVKRALEDKKRQIWKGSEMRSLCRQERRRALCPEQWNVFHLSPKGNQDTDIMEEIFNLCHPNVLHVLEESSYISFRTTLWSSVLAPSYLEARRLTVRQRRNPPTAGHPPSILFWTLLWGTYSSLQTLELKGAPTIPWFLVLNTAHDS